MIKQKRTLKHEVQNIQKIVTRRNGRRQQVRGPGRPRHCEERYTETRLRVQAKELIVGNVVGRGERGEGRVSTMSMWQSAHPEGSKCD